MPTLTLARSTPLCLAALAVLAGVPMAFAAKLDGGARYAGQTADGGSVQLRLTGDAKRVASMRIHYTMRCGTGHTESYTDILNAPVRGGKKFTSKGSYTGTSDRSLNRFKVHGALSRQKASGTFSLVYTGKANAKGGSVTCKTGRLRWHAARTG
jgi:hypothetical protein